MAENKRVQCISLVSKKIEAFSQSEILSMIDADTLASIKQSNPHPFFQAYSICHDGVSNPTIIGEVPKPITWTRKAVQSLKNVISKGVKFFNRHNKDNSTNNRESLGEVVASKQMEMDGELHHVVVGYFPDKSKVSEMDICSHEGDWNLLETIGGYVADSIEKLTGIALSSSSIERPAFKGALRLGMVQAFENNDSETIEKTESKMPEKLTFEEVKQAVREMNIFPRQIFSLEDIKNDRDFGKVITDFETKLKEKDDLLVTKETELKAKADEVNSLTQKTMLSTASDRLNNLFGELKLTDKQKTYVKNNFEKVAESLDSEKLNDDGLKGFVESQLDVYKANAEFFGSSSDSIEIDTESIDVEDYTTPENNEFLNSDEV